MLQEQGSLGGSNQVLYYQHDAQPVRYRVYSSFIFPKFLNLESAISRKTVVGVGSTWRDDLQITRALPSSLVLH